jgi:hypothetical protein
VPGVTRWAGDLTRQLFTYLRELSLRLNHAFTDDNAGLKTIADADLTEAEATLLTDIADGTTPSGGNVVGPASAVDDHFAKFDGTTGKLIKDGGAPMVVESGTWTPELHGTQGDPTYTKSGSWSGRYTKHGNVVFFSFGLLTASYTAGSGVLEIIGLPFAPADASNTAGGFSPIYMPMLGTLPSNFTGISGGIATKGFTSGSNVWEDGLRVIYTTSTGVVTDIPTTALQAGTNWIIGYGFYFTDE